MASADAVHGLQPRRCCQCSSTLGELEVALICQLPSHALAIQSTRSRLVMLLIAQLFTNSAIQGGDSRNPRQHWAC